MHIDCGDHIFLVTAYNGLPSLRCDENDPLYKRWQTGLFRSAFDHVVQSRHLNVCLQELDFGIVGLVPRVTTTGPHRVLPMYMLRKLRGAVYAQSGVVWDPDYLESLVCEEDFMSCCPKNKDNQALILSSLQGFLLHCVNQQVHMRALVESWENFDEGVVHEAIRRAGLRLLDPTWDVVFNGVTLKMHTGASAAGADLHMSLTLIQPWENLPAYVAVSVYWENPESRTC